MSTIFFTVAKIRIFPSQDHKQKYIYKVPIDLST